MHKTHYLREGRFEESLEVFLVPSQKRRPRLKKLLQHHFLRSVIFICLRAVVNFCSYHHSSGISHVDRLDQYCSLFHFYAGVFYLLQLLVCVIWGTLCLSCILLYFRQNRHCFLSAVSGNILLTCCSRKGMQLCFVIY